ncbi:alpha/beta-hydrolase [Dichomitus squalens]|nr:alpha/beta-hydrolase [Dichomitus squalens]
MDPTAFKDLQVKRGYTYHYYYSPASAGKPTLLLIHGFPSSSFDWARQVAHLKPKGYGIVVPDCLGYGGTSRPTDPNAFRHKLIAQDLVDILDAEGLETVIGIGHDWGSGLLSRLANWYPDRFTAFAWIAVPYTPAATEPMDFDQFIVGFREKTGSDTYGYWAFFIKPDSHVVADKNIDSFLTLVYPKEPEIWKDWIAPLGKAEEWVASDRRGERPAWFSEQEYAEACERFVKYSLESPMNYYRVVVFNLNIDDNKAIPEENRQVKKPALFVACKRDYVCHAEVGKWTMKRAVPHAEIIELDCGHWALLEESDRLNQALEHWLESLPSANKAQL